jgi:predicted histone-like DNA-binding protein
MPAKYNVIARKNPRDPDAPEKYYPSFVSSGKVTLRQLAEHIADISTVSSIDTLAVLEAFLQVVPKEMAEGNIVDLEEFGSFRLRIKTEGSDTPEEVTDRNIINILPQFLAGTAFKDIIDGTEFEKA